MPKIILETNEVRVVRVQTGESPPDDRIYVLEALYHDQMGVASWAKKRVYDATYGGWMWYNLMNGVDTDNTDRSQVIIFEYSDVRVVKKLLSNKSKIIEYTIETKTQDAMNRTTWILEACIQKDWLTAPNPNIFNVFFRALDESRFIEKQRKELNHD